MDQQGNNPDGVQGDRKGPLGTLRGKRAMRQVLAGELLSVAHLLRGPVFDPDGTRVGRVSDIVVRWVNGVAHPPVVAVLVSVGKGYALVDARDVTLEQAGIRLTSRQVTAATAVRGDGDVALARDVLDHQLVDVAGVQVVRAADVYLAKVTDGWNLAGIDVGLWALARRIPPRRHTCPPPNRAIDWADLQAFVARFPDPEVSDLDVPARAASMVGSSVQLASPAAEIRKLRAKNVAALLDGLDRNAQAQLATLADSSTVARVLRDLDPAKREALLSELDESDRVRLEALLEDGGQ